MHTLLPRKLTITQVPAWMWGGGVIISIIFTCLIMGLQFKQNVGVTILAILFAFIFSFIGAEYVI